MTGIRAKKTNDFDAIEWVMVYILSCFITRPPLTVHDNTSKYVQPNSAGVLNAREVRKHHK